MVQEQVKIEDLPLEKKLEFAKKIQYIDFYDVGKYVDGMDTVNSWCLADITHMDNRNMTLHFDGWSSKWDIVSDFPTELYSDFFLSCKYLLALDL